MIKYRLTIKIPGLISPGVLAVRNSPAEIQEVIFKCFDEWLDFYQRHYGSTFKTANDLLDALHMEVFEDYDDSIVNDTVKYLTDRHSAFYLPKIYNQLDSFLDRCGIGKEKRDCFAHSINKARDYFIKRSNGFMNKEFKAWVINDHAFNETIRRIK